MEQKQAAVTSDSATKSTSANVAQRPMVQESAVHEMPFHFLQNLHGVIGNRSTGRWLQAKLQVGDPHDAYEQEADQVAERVMRMAEPGMQEGTEHQLEVPAIQRKCADCEDEEGLQRKEAGSASGIAPPIVHEVLQSSGQPLDTPTRAFMEPRMGHDFSHVRIHTGDQATRSARAVKALAYTVGSDVVFDASRYAPGTVGGRRLLAHELTHVVQQSGRRTMLQRAETDTVPGCAPLTDSQADVDTKVNSSLTTAQAAAGTPPAGARVAQSVEDDLGVNVQTGRTAIEVWASSLPSTKQSLPAQSATKYAGVTYRLWSNPVFPILNPTMKINGICVGSDKLGHFFQQGATFRKTEAFSGTAKAEEESERSEGGGFGLQSTGVFSNADREANRQGGKFYADLLRSPMMKFAIKNYISSAWSEVDHPNFYVDSVGRQVWANTLTGSWAGHSWDKSPFADNPLSVALVATTAGAVTGTFTVGGVTGKIKNGVIQYNTTQVRATSAIGTNTTATPISGIHIDFDWTLGADSGKGFFDSGGERHLSGGWGRGTSNSDRGTWYIDHT